MVGIGKDFSKKTSAQHVIGIKKNREEYEKGSDLAKSS